MAFTPASQASMLRWNRLARLRLLNLDSCHVEDRCAPRTALTCMTRASQLQSCLTGPRPGSSLSTTEACYSNPNALPMPAIAQQLPLQNRLLRNFYGVCRHQS